MLTNIILIDSAVFVAGAVYQINPYFKDPAKAKYLNVGDLITDSASNTYEVTIVPSPMQDGDTITIEAQMSAPAPIQDVDYVSSVTTPDQINYDGEFKTAGIIHFVTLADASLYEYNVRASWDGSYEENLADIGDRLIDFRGKEFALVHIDPIQRFNTPFRVVEVHKTGNEPSIGPSSLFRATTNYGLYQGTSLDHRQHSTILNRDAAVIDELLHEIELAAAAGGGGGGGGTGGLTWLGGWQPATVYKKDDAVGLSGSSYIYINPIATSNISPPDPAYWDTIAASGTGDLHYVHSQNVASSLWSVVHNIGKIPSVSVVDSGGSMVIGDIHHVDTNSCTIAFSSAFTGTAYLN